MNEKFIKEDRAKDILLKTNKKKYGGLIKSESPDYHNNNVGIEITDATSDLEFLSFFNNNCNTSVEKLNVKLLKKNSNNKSRL